MSDANGLAPDVARLRNAGTDLLQLEVKAAGGGLPKSLWETVSAFANTAGGRIILGLAEEDDFRPVQGFDAVPLRDAVIAGLSSKVSPPVPAEVDVITFDGAPLLVIDVEELPAHDKPCFVVSKGKERGSYRRAGDGDHRMSTYEVFLHSANVSQPNDDLVIVADASPHDLDPDLVQGFLQRLRAAQRRAVEDVDDLGALLRLNVVRDDGGELRPTVAGLLALGRFPQQFLPQWMVTVAVYPGPAKESVVEDLRMLDNVTVDGPIPVMVDRSVRAVLRNLTHPVRARGTGAVAAPEIPVDALREAVTNALTHRDYSDFVRGEQVRIEVFPDRVEVTSPGGIWGGRTESDLFDGVSRSRNDTLALLLQDVPLPDDAGVVCENRGSGIPRMVGMMRQQGLALPRFVDRTTSFTCTLDRHGLLDPTMRTQLAAIGADALDHHAQCVLSMAMRGVRVDDQTVRYQLGLDTLDAQQLLARLATAGWLTRPQRARHSFGKGPRSAQPTLFDQPPSTPIEGMPQADRAILELFTDGTVLDVHQIVDSTELSLGYVRNRLRALVADQVLEATAPPTSRHRRYRLPSTA